MEKRPKAPKKGPQKSAEGQLPEESAQEQSGGVAQPQVAAADAEAQLQPCPKQRRHKQKIRQHGMTGTQGTQKTVVNS